MVVALRPVAVFGFGVFALLYFVCGTFMITYYMKTRCPYSSLAACQEMHKGVCGKDDIENSDECDRFVSIAEPCYCDKCKFCLSPDQRDHCGKSDDDRLQICRTSMHE